MALASPFAVWLTGGGGGGGGAVLESSGSVHWINRHQVASF